MAEQNKNSPKSLELIEATPEAANVAIDATPISRKLPESHGIIKRRRNKPLPEWIKNWSVESRERKNGRFDKYYYHKTSRVMCRSLIEVEKFELFGLHPTRGKKQVEKKVEDSSTARLKDVGAKKQEEKEEEESSTTLTADQCTQPTSIKRKRNYEDIDSNNSRKRRMCSHKNNSSTVPSEFEKNKVEEFLRESWNNLMKMTR